MEISLASIVQFCDTCVNREAIVDLSGAHNGLQFENSGKVYHIGAAVDASLESIQLAIEHEVDFLIVHHGLFWRSPAPITGSRAQKYRLLIEHDIAVYSSHMPLDVHPTLGNNASIAALLGREVQLWTCPHNGCPVAAVVDWNRPRVDLENRLHELFEHPVCMAFGPDMIEQAVIISGGGGEMMETFKGKNYHTLITGEGKQHHYIFAQEYGLNVYFCGHYATEVFGVKNLAEQAAHTFGIPCTFLPTACPL
ncbi:MAG: Nif3-like dinuclear metal center hexameric protein [Puniceicoccales bacterium]|jgi:dinuclear metal center YbgI/SA1388 family protein|nr:Nif3-like dinuclear metal center hexameric protein [Puniceicoccales bacterium]